MESYKPNELRILQSGKYAGSSLEVLMFKDHRHLSYLLQQISKNRSGINKSDFHLHLEWLLSKGEDRQSVMICPFCHQEKVEYFSMLFGRSSFSVGKNCTSCERCIDKLKGLAPADKQVEILPFRLSVLNRFWPGSDQKIVVSIFLSAFGLAGQRLTKEKLFKFFNEPGKPSIVKV